MRTDIDIYGRVDKGSSSIVSSTNLNGSNHRFVDDFSALPKNIKNDLTKVFRNENRRVGYLVQRATFTPNANPFKQPSKKTKAARSGSAASGASASGTGKSKPAKGGRF